MVTKAAAGPARNRVTPCGGIIASPGRGAWMGNRGRLHEGRGTRDIVRDYRSKAWLTCALSFRQRRVLQWDPARYTPLFFLDEAVALAAGHRPCAECRHRDFIDFAEAWPEAHGRNRAFAETIDSRLHSERLRNRDGHRLLTPMPWPDLPDGTFILTGQRPAVIVGDHLTEYDHVTNAYAARRARPRSGTAPVLTPPSTVEVLLAGYRPQIADTAR